MSLDDGTLPATLTSPSTASAGVAANNIAVPLRADDIVAAFDVDAMIVVDDAVINDYYLGDKLL